MSEPFWNVGPDEKISATLRGDELSEIVSRHVALAVPDFFKDCWVDIEGPELVVRLSEEYFDCEPQRRQLETELTTQVTNQICHVGSLDARLCCDEAARADIYETLAVLKRAVEFYERWLHERQRCHHPVCEARKKENSPYTDS